MNKTSKFNIKNKRGKLLVCIFFMLIILPNIIYGFIPDKYKQNSENRTLKEQPELNLEAIETYAKEYEEYYNDNLPFKDILVKLNNEFRYKVLNISPSNYVIKGEDGWLFYDSKYKEDEDTLGDYQGTNKYSEEELEVLTKSLLNKKRFLDKCGIELYLFIAPNKSQVYNEYMPSKYYKNQGESKTDELVDHIKKNTDINIVHPKDELLKLKSDHQLYSKLDTHWTRLGAYVGYVELMKSMDSKFEYKELSQLKIKATDIKSGDLASMINMNGKLDDVEYEVEDFKNNISSELVDDTVSGIKVYKSNNLNGKKLFMYRDSFASNMIQFISSEFEDSVFLWGSPFSEEEIQKEKPDVVVIEVVERYLNNLDR